ncbi:type II secretion system protein, partial [Yersinia enterocolitica]|nr:type II secretion system protein [Yersinia enterocolitica]
MKIYNYLYNDKGQAGFTLVETIVVLMVAIMMIGVSASVYNNYSESLKAKHSADELKSLGIAYKTFLSANRSDIISICDNNGGQLSGLEISPKEGNNCYISMNHIYDPQTGVQKYMPSGMKVPQLSAYKQPYFGRGVITINPIDVKKSVITPLVVAGDLVNYNSAGTIKLEELVAANIIQQVGATGGFTYSHGKSSPVMAGGNSLFDISVINRMSGIANLPAGFLFYTGGALGIESELGYLDQQTADRRYLLRDKIVGHPEYNTMNTDLLLGNNTMVTGGGVVFQNTLSVTEGHSCGDNTNNVVGLVKMDSDGFLVRCKKLDHSIISFNVKSTTYFNHAVNNEDSTGKPEKSLRNGELYGWQENGPQYPIGQDTGSIYRSEDGAYIWQYVSSEDAPDNGFFIWAKNNNYLENSYSRNAAIRVPEWYPYGKVNVCIIHAVDNNGNSILGPETINFGTHTYDQKKATINKLYNSELKNGIYNLNFSQQPDCFEMRTGQRKIISGKVFGFMVRYKGHLIPPFLHVYTTDQFCGTPNKIFPILGVNY